MDENNLIKSISEMSENSQMYNKMKNRYLDACQKLEELKAEIEEIITMLNPIKKVRAEITRVNSREINVLLEEIYQYLKTGTHISIKWLQNTYKDIPEKTIEYIFYHKLKKIPAIQKRRDGTITYYYL